VSNCFFLLATLAIAALKTSPQKSSKLHLPAAMGKKSTTAPIVASSSGAAAKDSSAPTIGAWDRSKFKSSDLSKLVKEGYFAKGTDDVKIPGAETTPAPPPGFRVMFLAFILRGLSLPAHEFLRGLLFIYGVQLHDLTPNSVLQIVCFVTLCECFLGVDPHWALWKRIFLVKRQGNYQTGGFGCYVRPEIKYFDLCLPENNQGWRTKWFYVKDQPVDGQKFGLEEFKATSDLQPKVSWRNSMTEEETAVTEPLMEEILTLRSTVKKEVTGLQLIRVFLERRVQPLMARSHRMWEYSGRKDSTRFTEDELKIDELDTKVRQFTKLHKKDELPRDFPTEPLEKNSKRTKVNLDSFDPCAFLCLLVILIKLL
jgi:hypothetical protein